jgi:DNA/RNA endonuclease G (NUC1)
MEDKLDRLRAFIGQLAPQDTEETFFEGVTPNLTATLRDPHAADVVDRLARRDEITPDDEFTLEAIVLPELRPAIDVIDGDFTITDPLWSHLDTDAARHAAIRATLSSIGRIDLPRHPSLPYAGTGWVAGDGLLMTNRHVAELFTSGVGVTNLRFLPGIEPDVDFAHEVGRDAAVALDIVGVEMVHPYWDMALLRVDGLSTAHPALTLSLRDPDDLVDHEIAVVGYPAFDPRNDAAVQHKVFGGVYNVKRLQPGKIKGRTSTTSFGKRVIVGTHDSSTLGGNSGSAVVDVTTGQVVALHFAGIYLKENYAVPTCDLAKDQRVVDAGLTFAGQPTAEHGDWDTWWGRTPVEAAAGPAVQQPRASDTAAATDEVTVRYQIPIEVTVRIAGTPTVVSGPAAGPPSAPTEAMVEPRHDTDYSNRTGYDSGFLDGFELPPPTVTDPAQVVSLADGTYHIPYHHFSIVMDKRRRLAALTACNADFSPQRKKPEPGHDYTRKGLSGLGPNDIELWFTDPRVPTEFQLTDKFFTKDKGAFDRGHVVRREDAAWGDSYQEVRDASGDTFHVTNCTPQVAGFNQASGQNWGALENLVAKQAGGGRVSVFAGPVLRDDDPVFLGAGPNGPVRVQIPVGYWKVIAAVTDGKLTSFGFVLEQDLSDVPLEFAVPPTWAPLMVPVKTLERRLRKVKFPAQLKKADQAATARGRALRATAGVELVSDEK